MAEEEKAVPPEAPKKKSPIIMIVVLVLVGLVLAGGISYFITTKLVTDSASSAGAQKPHDPGVFVKLGDPKEGMIVNVGGVKAGRFLKVGIALEMNPARKENVLDGKIVPAADSKIMDTTLQLLRTVKLEELDASKQEALKTRLRDDLNKVLGDGSVYAVYITSFVLQ